jgi:hypothetical protein
VRDRIAISLTKQVREEKRIICCRQGPGMPDLLPSTKHPLYPPRLHSLPQTLAQTYIDSGRNLFNFCAPLQQYFGSLALRDAKIESDEARRDLVNKAIGMRVSSLQMPPAQSEVQV